MKKKVLGWKINWYFEKFLQTILTDKIKREYLNTMNL